jgi:hypothetical protein
MGAKRNDVRTQIIEKMPLKWIMWMAAENYLFNQEERTKINYPFGYSNLSMWIHHHDTYS